MDFKDFDKLVKKYYPLNKNKSRYLILFNDGQQEFYKRKKTTLIKEIWGYDKLNRYTILN